jgi:hypothetical protein
VVSGLWGTIGGEVVELVVVVVGCRWRSLALADARTACASFISLCSLCARLYVRARGLRGKPRDAGAGVDTDTRWL